MKNQVNNTSNGSAEFINLNNVKNPIYQPLAGKSNRSSEKVKADPLNDHKMDIKPSDRTGDLMDRETKIFNTETQFAKPALNLEGTLKLVEELH